VAEPVIEVVGLRKTYGGREAVAGIDLHVTRGEVFAFLGPNGAGKTTAVEILEGYRSRDSGDVRVIGVDPARGDLAWRSRIGVVLQESRPEPRLTVRESLAQYAGFYPTPRAVDEVVELVGLRQSVNVQAGKLSGGQQRRLDVGLAIIGAPEVMFLDEPTTGFDPTARREAWAMLEALRDDGMTIFLTTHYLEEAEVLADRVAVIAAGRIVAEGTPATIGGRDTAESVISYRLDGIRHEIRSADPTTELGELLDSARATGIRLDDLEVGRPSLEDTYLRLIGEQ
jgi:ABC-2 type transport system ATP-binding protein